MRRTHVVCLFLAGLAISLAAAGCGSSDSITAPQESSATGAAVLQGTVAGSQSGLQVGVVGTPLVAAVDDDGQFVLSQVPSGTVTLKLDGGGIDARVVVPGLSDGQVTSIKVQLSGGAAQLTASPSCAPTAETFFSGWLESIAGTRLVVSGRPVEVGTSTEVWRGDRRSTLDSLQVGDKLKVWGTLRGDGVVLAKEIQALTTEPGGWTWIVLSGVIESVKGSSRPSVDVHANPNTPGPSKYPTLVVKGVTVTTNADTKFRRADGSPCSGSDVKAGQNATVEGWKRSDGTVKAERLTIGG
jgi:hypothetical protein